MKVKKLRRSFGSMRLLRRSEQSVDKVDIVIGGYGTNLRARRGAQSRGMVTGRAGSHPLRRFRQKTDCESAHGEHVDWESA